MASPEEIIQQLTAPFDADAIQWRILRKRKDGTAAEFVPYVDAREIQDRLDNVLGFLNWKTDYHGIEGGVICNLSFRIGGEWITKADGASSTDIEPVKGGVSDAFKRAAVVWGIGRYLYGANSVWASIDQYGNCTEPQKLVLSFKDNKKPVQQPQRQVNKETGEVTRQEPQKNGSSPSKQETNPDAGKIIDITIDQIEVSESKDGTPFLKLRALDEDGNKVLVSAWSRQPFADQGFVDQDTNDWTTKGEVIDFKPEIAAKAIYNNKGYLNVHEITTDFLTWEKQGGLMVTPDVPF